MNARGTIDFSWEKFNEIVRLFYLFVDHLFRLLNQDRKLRDNVEIKTWARNNSVSNTTSGEEMKWTLCTSTFLNSLFVVLVFCVTTSADTRLRYVVFRGWLIDSKVERFKLQKCLLHIHKNLSLFIAMNTDKMPSHFMEIKQWKQITNYVYIYWPSHHDYCTPNHRNALRLIIHELLIFSFYMMMDPYTSKFYIKWSISKD